LATDGDGKVGLGALGADLPKNLRRSPCLEGVADDVDLAGFPAPFSDPFIEAKSQKFYVLSEIMVGFS
jgi:hypothetical protein